MNIKCTVRISHTSKAEIPGVILAFVPRENKLSWNICPDIPITYTTDAIVKLESFSCGVIVQLPLNQVTIPQGSSDV